MANWLFSTEFDEAGNPLGIGLSMWRFNIGSGSSEQGESSGIANPWNRVECFLGPDGRYDFSKQAGQQWFLKAARRRGVENFLAFTIAPPWFMSLNGKTTSEGKIGMNIRPDMYDDYARFLTTVVKHFSDEMDIPVGYISPVNEPQWDWNTTRQEGTFAVNADCFDLIAELDREITRQSVESKIVFGEAGALKYLYAADTDVPETDDQIREFFSPGENYYIRDMNNVAPIVSGHSYWSTWDVQNMIDERGSLARRIDEVSPGLGYWQTEYCVMEDNPETGGGRKRDLGMDMALYVARVIHYDLTVAEASSWQWWTALSPYDYKDGLIYLDDGTGNGLSGNNPALDEQLMHDGVARDSKLMWALGNFSRFIRPGMQRVEISSAQGSENDHDLLTSAWQDNGNTTVVVINMSGEPRSFSLYDGAKKYRVYETSESRNLGFREEVGNENIIVSARSIITLISQSNN
jgi:O-glycosyl hydrolase